MFTKEQKEELKKFKLELKKEEERKKYLLSANADVGILEDAVQLCNQDPNLQVTVKLGDGTVIELKTIKDKKVSNPLFTGAAYLENN